MEIPRKIKSIIIGVALLTALLVTTWLAAQSAGFNDSVKLKNGTIIENVKAVVTKDSLVVTQPDGTANVYSKKEVSEVKRNGGKFSEATPPAKKVPANTSLRTVSLYTVALSTAAIRITTVITSGVSADHVGYLVISSTVFLAEKFFSYTESEKAISRFHMFVKTGNRFPAYM